MVMVGASNDAEKDQAAGVVAAAQALIEEARRRQRRRWFLRGIAALAVALVIGAVLVFSVGGAGSSSGRNMASGTTGALLLTAHKTTVEGTFLGIGGPAHARPMMLSGTIRFVADHGRKTYRTKATDGHWKAKLPAGGYTVEGLSKQVNGGRHWSQATHLVVRAGHTGTNVRVIYGTIR
jgi:hypothetical protein